MLPRMHVLPEYSTTKASCPNDNHAHASGAADYQDTQWPMMAVSKNIPSSKFNSSVFLAFATPRMHLGVLDIPDASPARSIGNSISAHTLHWPRGAEPAAASCF